MARAGSPRRAGSVADISTPIIVAEVTSRRRSGRSGSAALTIQNQEAARKNSESPIRAQAIRTQVRSEPAMLVTTLSTPILSAARLARMTPTRPAAPKPMRRATRRRPLPAFSGAGSSEGRRCGPRRGPPSAGRIPAQWATRSPALAGRGASSARS